MGEGLWLEEVSEASTRLSASPPERRLKFSVASPSSWLPMRRPCSRQLEGCARQSGLGHGEVSVHSSGTPGQAVCCTILTVSFGEEKTKAVSEGWERGSHKRRGCLGPCPEGSTLSASLYSCWPCGPRQGTHRSHSHHRSQGYHTQERCEQR